MTERLDLAQLSRLVAAGTPLIYIVTANEGRTEALIARAAQGIRGMPAPQIWTCASGFAKAEGTSDPVAALRLATEKEGPGLFLFKDLHWFWGGNPLLQRVLKDFSASRRSAGRTLIFLGPETEIPPALAEEILLLEHGLPDREEIRSFLEANRERDPSLAEILADPSRLVLAAQGLDLAEVERAIRLARVTRGAGPEEVAVSLFRSKKQILAKSGILEFVDNDINPDHVGGMENLKGWMEKRERVFGAAALNSGQSLPKGVLMMGISGCGKSLFVKAIAARWQLPLIRLDMATVYEGTFGSPESSLRRACRTAEALAPCVLWIDEMEAGISTQGFKAEGGAASRVLGYFLTWMQEKKSPVFVAATANAIEMLPAEVLRKGRFDEIFYIALPGLAEREEIFRIHLRRQGIDPDSIQTAMLAHSAKGFSGAEIEQAVAGAAFEALALGRPVGQQDLLEAISRTVPISITMAEQIKRIEAWAFKRAVPANRGGEK